MALALQHSPELRAAQQDVQASEGAVIQAGARPNPELQTLMEDTRAQTRTTTVQLAQPIELGGKRAAHACRPHNWPRLRSASNGRRGVPKCAPMSPRLFCLSHRSRARAAGSSIV